jgi:hypothetical protein
MAPLMHELFNLQVVSLLRPRVVNFDWPSMVNLHWPYLAACVGQGWSISSAFALSRIEQWIYNDNSTLKSAANWFDNSVVRSTRGLLQNSAIGRKSPPVLSSGGFLFFVNAQRNVSKRSLIERKLSVKFRL